MYILTEQREWVKAKILLTNFQYIEKFRLVGIIYKYTKSGFELAFPNCYLSAYFWVITAIIFFPSVKLQHSDTSGVEILAEEQPCITQFMPGIINQKQINIRIIKLRCISAPRSWPHVNNPVVLTILTLQHIQCLHLMYVEVAWVLVSSGTQVQLQIIPDPDYLLDYLCISYDYDSKAQPGRMLLINVFIKKLMKKVKNTKNFPPISDAVFLKLMCN